MNTCLTNDIKQKYILVELEESKRICLFGNPNVKWHKDIAAEVEQSGQKINEVIGGGKLWLKSAEKVIYLWGTSTNYGLAPIELVKELLKKNFPDYQVLVEEPASN